jgi:DUF438 domain-containing protein
MKITDALLGEHALLYALFDYVRDTALNSDDLRDLHSGAAAIEGLLVPHAKIEEDLLFPRLEPHLGQMGPLAVMRAEHNEVDELLEAARQGTDIATVKSLMSRLLDLAHNHFQKEERVLFAMAGRCLDEAELTELGDEWAEIRKVTINSQGCGAAV